MAYRITQYTHDQADKHGVTVRRSTVKGKKIDVFKDGQKIASVGAIGYNDYPTFMQKYGKEFADKRRKAYKLRHEKDRKVKGTPGYWADKLLW